MRIPMKISAATLLSGIDSGASDRWTWYLGSDVCALSDSERHLGHAVKEGDFWTAYDAIHPDPLRNGFLTLGRFRNIVGAIEAIQSSVVAVLESQLVPGVAKTKTFLT